MSETKKAATKDSKAFKQCPFLQPTQYMSGMTSCCENECALWVYGMYTTENRFDRTGRCALVVIAIKNSEGKLPV